MGRWLTFHQGFSLSKNAIGNLDLDCTDQCFGSRHYLTVFAHIPAFHQKLFIWYLVTCKITVFQQKHCYSDQQIVSQPLASEGV